MSQDPSSRLPESVRGWLDAIAQHRPLYADLLAAGDEPVAALMQALAAARIPALQDPGDYIEQFARRVAAAQGDAAAHKLRARLARCPLVFTANHLCLECLPLTVQSLLIAAFAEAPGSILPVMALGLIPADNISYPIGLQLARRSAGKPLRLPVLDLSNRLRRQVTLRLDPYSAVDVDAAGRRLDTMAANGLVGEAELRALRWVLHEVLAHPALLSGPSFAAQIEAALPRLWNAWYAPSLRGAVPDIAYVTSEAVCTPLVIADLQNPDTLVHRLFFDPVLRNELLRRLDGVPCCWTDGGRSGGSALLWEVTAERRTSALLIDNDAFVTASGKRIALSPAALVDGLESGNLVPTSFLSLIVVMARGFAQIGGFNQIDYLAAMQRGLSAALAASGYRQWAEQIAAPQPTMLTAGLTAVLVRYGNGDISAAGGIELIAHGGLRADQLERAKSLALSEALAPELPNVARMVLGETAAHALLPADPSAWNSLLIERLPVIRLD